MIEEATIPDSESGDLSIESYECDFCKFSSLHLKGLKVHVGRKHRIKCEDFRLTFQDEDCRKRHLETNHILDNIEGKVEAGLKLKSYKVDEKCLGIFDTGRD